MNHPRSYSVAMTDTSDTTLGRAVTEWHKEHPDVSGFYPLISGMDAFGARLALIDMAERSIDAQYFLMKNDMAGLVFVGSLLEAADRGVRVRLLLDDVFTEVDDEKFLLVSQHPNIEMRLFNPVGRGGFYWLNYLGDFDRANRRMHNKSFTVDNQVSIVGGRNIAEEHFELNKTGEFRDLDILGLGAVANQIAKTFDRYWNHELSVPVEAFSSSKGQRNLDAVRSEFSEELRQKTQSIYVRAIESELIQSLFNNRIPLFPATAEVITDDPEKLLNKVSRDHQVLITHMAEVIANADSEVIVVTPYLIPGKQGIEFWNSVTARNIRVTMLTNSLASNNHIPVHAAYARYRHRLIQVGVDLHEMRVDATEVPKGDDEEAFESVTLHTKAIMIDRKYLFVGSLNLDPRSIDINTEMGVLVDSADMSSRIVEPFMKRLPNKSYRVVEDVNGSLRWHGLIEGKEVIEDNEPQTGRWRRFKAFMSRMLPESQL
ncbi:MAG: phospholipase D family protein [Gammaproteobacteria bacterium]|nr:phospholipase D family protein [Gammaproteobacteria bacterium]